VARSNPAVPVIVVFAVFVLVVAGIGATLRVSLPDLGSANRPAEPAAVPGGSINGRTAAVLDIASAAPSVIVRSVDLGGNLYRVSGATVEQSADVVRAISDGNDTMTVELNYHVTWRVRLSDGALSETLDMRRIPLSGIEIAGAAGRVDLTLGTARGDVPINVSGRVDTLAVHVTDDMPVQVRAGAGAGRLTLDGVTHAGVAAASRFASDGWDAATDRYDIDATAPVNTVTVDHR
jgi:hypothetical protein